MQRGGAGDSLARSRASDCGGASSRRAASRRQFDTRRAPGLKEAFPVQAARDISCKAAQFCAGAPSIASTSVGTAALTASASRLTISSSMRIPDLAQSILGLRPVRSSAFFGFLQRRQRDEAFEAAAFATGLAPIVGFEGDDRETGRWKLHAQPGEIGRGAPF